MKAAKLQQNAPEPPLERRDRPSQPRARAVRLREYFETALGNGFLATADQEGRVNVAIYDRPLVLEDDLLAFATKQRRTREYLTNNPHAVYAFYEPGPRRGMRLYLRLEREEVGGALLEKIKHKAEWLASVEEASELVSVLYFRVLETLPLVRR